MSLVVWPTYVAAYLTCKYIKSRLKLFFVNGVIDWDEGTVKGIHLTTFAKGFQNLPNQTATVQEIQFAN
jgi:hypothetical protein